MKTIRFSSPTKHQGGLSLFEVLVVVTAIGLLAAIALPSLRAKSISEEASHRRNAQQLATIATTANIAGAISVVPGDLSATVNLLVQGVSPTSGPFKGREFRIGGLDAAAKEGAETYLQVVGSQLIYVPHPGQSQSGYSPAP